MSRITSIYVSDKIESQARKSQNNFSGRLSTVCDRYNEIIKNSSPLRKFTDYEKVVLVNKLRGRVLKPAGIIRSLSNEINTDDQFLIEKLEKLSYVEAVSLVEAIEKIIDEEREDGEN